VGGSPRLAKDVDEGHRARYQKSAGGTVWEAVDVLNKALEDALFDFNRYTLRPDATTALTRMPTHLYRDGSDPT